MAINKILLQWIRLILLTSFAISCDYTPLGQVFGFYSELIFVESNDCKDAGAITEALKNEAISKNRPLKNRKPDRTEYIKKRNRSKLENCIH